MSKKHPNMSLKYNEKIATREARKPERKLLEKVKAIYFAQNPDHKVILFRSRLTTIIKKLREEQKRGGRKERPRFCIEKGQY